MGLDLSKLENVRHHDTKVIARCPACAEGSNDRKGEHLFIDPSGRFGCVVFPDADGHKHRQRIFELVGLKTSVSIGFKVKQPFSHVSDYKVIQKDILGRLGQMKSHYARNEFPQTFSEIKKQDVFINSVPAVPDCFFNPNEKELLQGIDSESLKWIYEVKRFFNGTVTSVIDRNPY